MGFICDFCGDQRAIVHCRSDAASLCLSCDRNVHSANALSRRHSRTLLCERCHSQPAFVRCPEENISLCQYCDYMGHSSSAPISSHKRQTINCYSGCPTATELSSIWSFVLDLPSASDACEQELGLMSIAENSAVNSWGPYDNNAGQNVTGIDDTNKFCSLDKSTVWHGSSSRPHIVDQAVGSANVSPKSHCGTKSPGLAIEDEIYEDFNLDEGLDLENYEELFGVSLSHSEELFENGGIDSLFRIKSIAAANSSCQGAGAAEVVSIGFANNIKRQASSNAASADSTMSAMTEPNICFSMKQDHNGESNAGDHQDSVDSSILLMVEPSWCPPCPESSFQLSNRSDAVMRYKEKKKTRKFDKKVRYVSRKVRADTRRRVKGRFVKAGDAYDYDPMSPTRSY